VGQAIVAGDGYLYVPYETSSSSSTTACDNTGSTHATVHMGILKVGSDGSTTDIAIGNWAQDCVNTPTASCGAYSVGSIGAVITNADQGVLYSWQLSNCTATPSSCSSQNNLTTVAADGSTSTASVNYPGANTYVQPVLQRPDGSYVGTYTNGSSQSFMVAFTLSGQQLWNQPNDRPMLVTSDGGVIGASGTVYDQGGNSVGKSSNSSAIPSWAANSYSATSNASSSVALPVFDEFDATSLWGIAGANASQNEVATLQCCTPSLALVFGVPSNDSSKPAKPDVSKSYISKNISCSKGPSQIISDMEANFGNFANYNGNFGTFGIPFASATVTFSGTVSMGATISIHNVNVDRITSGSIKSNTFDVGVKVTQVTATSFTFTTLPGHVLYPATISFTASSSGTGKLTFEIDVNGNFANGAAERGYYAAGSNLENHIWNHVLDQVQSDCH
jgi:hypothetical protein